MVLHEGGNYNDMISSEIEKHVPPPESTASPETPATKPGWVHTHPFLATTIGVGGLLVLGATLFVQRSDVDPNTSSGAWGGAGGFFAGTIRNMTGTRVTPQEIIRLQSSQEPYAAIPIIRPTTSDGIDTAGVDEIANILAQLVQNTPVTPSTAAPTTPDSYSFIPQGLVSTEVSTAKRTAVQQRLYDYGNNVGMVIKSYEDTHYGTTQIMKDHIEDRANADKANGVKRLGLDMQQLGIELRNLPGIPTEVAGMHKEYANAYIRAGIELVKVAETTSDESFVNAVTTYNAGAEKITTQFLLIVALLGTNEVVFSSSDAGNMFMFSPDLSLVQ